jgi:GAF domain-containing protein
MDREILIVNTFAEMADAMVGHLDPFEFLHALCRRCVELLACDETGVLVRNGDGQLQVMGSSSERIETLELLQAHSTEGPCFDCIRSGEVMASDDLERDRDRWPTFAPAAVQLGFRAVRTIPMQARGEAVGALNLFGSQPGPIAPRDQELAQGIADMASVALLQDRTLRDSESVAEQLQGALSSRIVIEQAKGMLGERHGIDVGDAFERMRTYARRRNTRLHDIAQQLMAGELDPDDLEDPLPA